jgi:hypothetical protein
MEPAWNSSVCLGREIPLQWQMRGDWELEESLINDALARYVGQHERTLCR